MGYSVGQVARFAKVSVRTLHHYDEIGLFSPSERTDAGYRRYSDADLDRLHRILAYRRLGFSLEETAAILDDPHIQPLGHLRRQRGMLLQQIEQLYALVAAIEREMEAHQMGISLTPEERFEVFGDFDPAQHEDEVQERWGGSDAYEQSRQRTASYTKADWQRILAEHDDISRQFAAMMEDGTPADAAAAMDLAEEHRQWLDRWHYDCSPEMHLGLTQMYVDDSRFTATYEAIAPGLATYIRDAAQANAQRLGMERS